MLKNYFIYILLIISILSCKNTTPSTNNNMTDSKSKWWKESVVYQVYPRSFKDSNGDGVGDIRGIIEKLDYIKSLGIDVIWLNPIYDSPNEDNGYDIRDYRKIMAEMGTMEDFETLLKEIHNRKMKLVMDLVVNHCSDEHQWFQASRQSRDNPYRQYFHWWDAEKGTPPKRWSFFDVDENAWRFDKQTNSYYLHYFSVKQPDLNWENPKVRQEVYDLMKFWFDKGIDGFRMDVVAFFSKDTNFPPLPAEYGDNYIPFYANGPRLHDYLQEMDREVLSKYDIMTVGEGAGVDIKDALKFVDEDRKELNMFYHFDATNWGRKAGSFIYTDENNRKVTDLKNVFARWDAVFAEKGWGTVYLGNHDQARMVSRFTSDKEEHRIYASKMLNLLLLTHRATPYVYYGDELGMTNIYFDNIKDYNDVQTRNTYEGLLKRGEDVTRFMEDQKKLGRDNGRTPMQWDDSEKAGFTTGTSWMKVNPNKSFINVVAAEKDPNSTLNFFKKIIELRKQEKTLIYGKYEMLDKDNEQVYAYMRSDNDKKFVVLLNFSATAASFDLKGIDVKNAKIIVNNYPDTDLSNNRLKPFQAILVAL